MIHKYVVERIARCVAALTMFSTFFFYKMIEGWADELTKELSFEVPWYVWMIGWMVFYIKYYRVVKGIENFRDEGREDGIQ